MRTDVAPDDDWKLPKRAECCSGCAAELLPEQEVTTVIALAAEGPERKDLCKACGELADSGPDTCFWRRRLPPGGTRRQVVDYALVRELFERMLPRPEESYRRMSYLMALLLVRKRQLKLHGFVARAGREVMVVSRGAGQPEFDVPAPFLAPEDLPALREKLSRLLAADLSEGDLDLSATSDAASD